MIRRDGYVKVGFAWPSVRARGACNVQSMLTAGLLETVIVQVSPAHQHMSPEQIDGRPLDARSELFSLACCSCEMATEPIPLPAGASSTPSVPTRTPVPAAPITAELPLNDACRVILKLLQRDPADRYRRPSTIDKNRIAYLGVTGSAYGVVRRWRIDSKPLSFDGGMFQQTSALAGLDVVGLSPPRSPNPGIDGQRPLRGDVLTRARATAALSACLAMQAADKCHVSLTRRTTSVSGGPTSSGSA